MEVFVFHFAFLKCFSEKYRKKNCILNIFLQYMQMCQNHQLAATFPSGAPEFTHARYFMGFKLLHLCGVLQIMVSLFCLAIDCYTTNCQRCLNLCIVEKRRIFHLWRLIIRHQFSVGNWVYEEVKVSSYKSPLIYTIIDQCLECAFPFL